MYAASIITEIRIKTFDRSNEGCQFFGWRWIQARSDGQSRQLGHSVFLISFFSLYQSRALRLPFLSSKDHPSRYWSSAACRPAVGKDASAVRPLQLRKGRHQLLTHASRLQKAIFGGDDCNSL